MRKWLFVLTLVFLSLSAWPGCTTVSPITQLSKTPVLVNTPDGQSIFYTTSNPLSKQHDDQGIALVKSGQYEQAVDEFSKAILAQPKEYTLYSNRAIAYELSGNNTAAIHDLSWAIATNPQDYMLYHQRATYYIYDGDYDLALPDADKTIELQPAEAAAYQMRGVIYSALKQYDKAIADYTWSIQLQPSAITYYTRANAYLKNKQYDAAVADYSKSIEIDPTYTNAYYNRGAYYWGADNYTLALADLNKVIELDPKYAIAYFTRGQVYDALGKKDEAIADFSTCISNTTDQSIVTLAMAELKTLSPTGALPKPVGHEILDPQTNQYNEQAIAFLQQDRYNDAINLFNKAIALEPTVGYLYRNRGLADDKLGNTDSAIADYTSAIKYNKDDYLAFFYRGYAYDDKKEYALALADMNSAISINPQDADSYGERGAIYSNLKQWDKAIDDLNKSIELKPNELTFYNRAYTYQDMGKYDLAIADYTKCLELQPLRTNAYYQRGLCYFALGDNVTALADLDKALQMNSTSDWGHLARGRVNNALGKQTEAVADFNSAIRNSANKDIIAQATQELAKLGATSAPASGASSNTTPTLSWGNSQYGIKIKYPEGWLMQEPNGGNLVAFMRPQESVSDNRTERLAILVRDLPPQYKNLDEFVQKSMPTPPPGWSITSTTPVTIAGLPAYKAEITVTANGENLKMLEFMTLKNNEIYYLTYMANADRYDEFLGTIMQMVDSVEITGPP